jgi:hypothetical protein
MVPPRLNRVLPSGRGLDAKVRTPIESADGNRKSAYLSWDDSWEELFAGKEANYEQRRKITDAYDSFMSQFSQELSLGLESALRPRGSHKQED